MLRSMRGNCCDCGRMAMESGASVPADEPCLGDNGGGIYVSGIAPGTAKHCDLGHIADPNVRNYIPSETNPDLGLKPNDTTFVFAVAAIPNHRGNVILGRLRGK